MISSALLTSKTAFHHINPVHVSIPRGPRPAPSSSVSKAPYVDVTAVQNAQRIALDNHVELNHPNYSKSSVHTQRPELIDNSAVHALAAANHAMSDDCVRGHVQLEDNRVTVGKGLNVRSHGNKPFSEGVKFTNISNQRMAGEMMSHAQTRDVLDDPGNLVPPDHVRQLKGCRQFDTSVTAHVSTTPKDSQTHSLGYLSYIEKHPAPQPSVVAAPHQTIFDTSIPDTFHSAMRSKPFRHIANRRPGPIAMSRNCNVSVNDRYNEHIHAQPTNVVAAPVLNGLCPDAKSRDIQTSGHHVCRDVSKMSFIDRATQIVV